MDELTYTYSSGTNKLQRVTDAVSSTAYAGDLDSQPSNNYAYDSTGNMIQDLEKGIGYVLYDINNLPIRVCKTNGDVIDYIYDSRGERAKKITANLSTWYINGVGSKTSFIKTSNINDSYTVNLYGNDAIGQARVVGGVPIRYYYLKDHLGSIRVTVDGTYGTLASYDDYYPFGMVMDNRSASFGNPDARYKFTGKERDIETGYDYFGARYYDSRIGRWLSMDPLTEKYPGLSPYNYVLNNPLKLVDPDGRKPWSLSLGAPILPIKSWEEFKVRFFGTAAVAAGVAAAIYAPRVASGVASWAWQHPLETNNIAIGLMDVANPGPGNVSVTTAYHWTKADNVANILEEGLKLSRSGGKGPGLYLAEDAVSSSKYGDALLKVKVDLGNVLDLTAKEGKQLYEAWLKENIRGSSNSGEYLIQQFAKEKGYNSIKFFGGPEGKSLWYNVLEPDRIKSVEQIK